MPSRFKPMPGRVGVMSLIEGPERRISFQMQSIFRSLLSVWSVRDVVFAGGGYRWWDLAASHRPGSQHARAPTRHQAPSVQSARHRLPTTARVSTPSRLCASYRRGRELSPPPPSPCSSSLPGPGLGPGPPSILESSNEAATTTCDVPFGVPSTDDDGDAPSAMPSLPFLVTRASGQ